MSSEAREQLVHIAEWGALRDPDALLHLGESGSSLGFNI
jgi:hypothetical protein